MINPTVDVGDSLELAEEFDVKHKYPTYYVVDVALEGLKLLKFDHTAASDTIPTPREPVAGSEATALPRRTYDRLLDVTDVSKLLRGRLALKPCAHAHDADCKLVNPYCPRLKSPRGLTASGRTAVQEET